MPRDLVEPIKAPPPDPVASATTPDADALAALDAAARAIAGLRSVDEVLQLIVDRVRDLVDARYAALGIVGPAGKLERFITAGLDPHEREAIGPLPTGRGLLGLIIREGRSYRIPSIAGHADSSGFPPNHPPMTSFLGVPVTSGGERLGNLYLTDKRSAREFSAADQSLVETFALHAGIAIENARLHAQAGRLAVVDERDRIGRDLHDGIIQALYAVSLSLEDVPDMMVDAPGEATRRVDQAIESIHLTIRDIRNFIYGLRPEAVDGAQVLAGIAALAQEVRDGGLIDVVATIDPAADPRLSAEAGLHLLSLVREALSNATRHGRPRRIDVRLSRSDGESVLEIADDGVGFDPARAGGDGHHGLVNMRIRADTIGARLDVDSRPGAGTTVRLALPGPATRTAA
ncbi:MAG TPA: GAF domain-containing sensor histidine kinase [Candidatus Limnocylindrales bacterium]|nr:GAF domain-containing sensor histidine kinase [Candidatus Limnocylindrales bacterium]